MNITSVYRQRHILEAVKSSSFHNRINARVLSEQLACSAKTVIREIQSLCCSIDNYKKTFLYSNDLDPIYWDFTLRSFKIREDVRDIKLSQVLQYLMDEAS